MGKVLWDSKTAILKKVCLTVLTRQDIRFIVTHPGRAHMDDFMSVCILLGLVSHPLIIYRREPNTQDIHSPDTWVLDIGGNHNTKKNNYDHHQFPVDTVKCTLSLLAEKFELDKDFLPLWWSSAVELDSLGPFQYAKNHEIDPNIVMQLCSPIDGAMLHMFNMPEINSSHLIYFFMKQIGESFWQRYNLMQTETEDLLKNSKRHVVNGSLVLFPSSRFTPAVNALQKKMGFVATVQKDDRDENNLSLFRYNDNPKVDFRAIKDNPKTVFVHSAGFIAKVRNNPELTEEEILELLQKSISI